MKYRLTRKRNDESTLRKVWNDNKTECLGAVGTFADFKAKNIVEFQNFNGDAWICLVNPRRTGGTNGIGATREDAINNTDFGR